MTKNLDELKKCLDDKFVCLILAVAVLINSIVVLKIKLQSKEQTQKIQKIEQIKHKENKND